MSSLCVASSKILILQDEEINKLLPALSHPSHKFVEREIDVILGCNFIAPDKVAGNPKYKLDVVGWQNGATRLCGSCSFCSLLSDSMHQSVESDLWDGWHIRSGLEHTDLSRPFDLHANAHFERLIYQMDHDAWLSSRPDLRMSVNERVAYPRYALVLTGYLLFHQSKEISKWKLNRFEIDLAFELFGEEDDPVVKLLKIHRRPLHGERLSDGNVAKIHDWIRDCDESHERCWPKSSGPESNQLEEMPGFLPTRMIDIGESLRGSYPKLVITSELEPSLSRDKSTKYMALSYCWGSFNETTKLLKTTHDTIKARIEKIELDIMPQTFRDAVNVAGKLGIQYLWIDSLCILQDDEQDWQIESSKMAEIFSNAYLTLIAASGSGCNDGFLNRGLPGISCDIPAGGTSGIASRGQFSLRFRRGWRTSDKMAEFVNGKWVTRGWTFQEERLARRALIFGETKHFFDCRTLERVEDTDMYRMRPEWVTSVTEHHQENSANYAESDGINEHWTHWLTLCVHYSYRELTYAQDKLPAISGIASKFAQKVRSEYLAGLWNDNLTHDLFWNTVEIATKPTGYRAPSWSWASVDGRITWPSWQLFSDCSYCTSFCIIQDAKTTHVGLDAHGAVKDGYLKVQGFLESVELVWYGQKGDQSPWNLNYRGVNIGKADLDLVVGDARLEEQQLICQALAVAQCNIPGKSTSIRGLLLESNERQRENYNEYKRLGTFTLFPQFLSGQYGSLGVHGGDSEQVIMIA